MLESGLFDADFYLTRNPDVSISGMDPARHYVLYGASEGRDPHPWFDTSYYLERNPDVADSGINPLVHFLNYGAQEGRDPHPAFATSFYLKENPDVAASRMNPLLHYWLHGQREGRRPTPGNPGAGTPQIAGSSQASPGPEGRGLPLPYPSPTSRLPVLLIADNRVPEFDRDAGSVRMFALARLLAARYQVFFYPTLTRPDEKYIDAIQSLGIRLVPHETDMEGYLEAIGAKLKVALLSRPDVAAKLLPMVRIHAPSARVIYDTVDLYWLRSQRGAVATGDYRLQEEARRFEVIEGACCLGSDVVITVSDYEREILLKRFPALEVHVVPIVYEPSEGDDCEPQPRKDLLFVGNYLHLPNIDGVRFFLDKVFPLIQSELPHVRFHVVGSDPPPDILARASESVLIPGYVEDIESYFRDCRVFVAPLTYGAGVKGKVGQSMALGLPVVTTHVGAEGLGLEHGTTALIADAPADFAREVVRVYQDADLWIRISTASRTLVRERFSPAVIAPLLLRALGDDVAVTGS